MTSDLDYDWNVAAIDAGIDSIDVILYPVAATDNGYGAMHFPPDLSPHSWDDAFVYSRTDRETLRALQDRHVIVLDQDLRGPRRVFVLRHEAEHVAQHEASPAAAEFALRLAVALPREANWLYLAMPHERDADAAATELARSLQIEATPEDLEGRDRFLYSAPWPPPDRSSLPLRLLGFSLLYVDDFDLACTSSQVWPAIDPTELIDKMLQGGAAARAGLRDHLSGALDQIVDHGIDRETWDVMPRAERNAVSDNLRARVLEVEASAMKALDGELSA